MKKVFALMAITSLMVACNNSSETKETPKDTVTAVAPADTATQTAPADTSSAPKADTAAAK